MAEASISSGSVRASAAPERSRAQRARRALRDGGVDLVRGGELEPHPRPGVRIEDLGQRPDAVVRVKAQPRLPLDDDLVGRVLPDPPGLASHAPMVRLSDPGERGRLPPVELIHTCYRITDPERSVAFYEALGLEKRRELPIRDEAVNYFLGVPGQDSPELELTYNFGVDSYELGTGYGHIALTVEDLDGDARAAGRAGDRAGARAVHGARGRLAALLRP